MTPQVQRGMRTAAWAAMLLLTYSSAAIACPVCFGNADSNLTQGAASGVLFMVIITYCLLLGVGGMVTFWAVRARRMRLSGAADAPPASTELPDRTADA